MNKLAVNAVVELSLELLVNKDLGAVVSSLFVQVPVPVSRSRFPFPFPVPVPISRSCFPFPFPSHFPFPAFPVAHVLELMKKLAFTHAMTIRHHETP